MKRIGLITLVVVLSTFVITADAYGAPKRSPQTSHDVEITNMSAPSSCAQGDTIPVIVTVENQGNCSESFVIKLNDVTDGLEIGSKSVTLAVAGQGGMDETVDLIFDSPASGKQYFGYPVVCGDVNGDGYDDLLITASQWNKAQGRAYLYYGGENMDATPDKVFTGEAADDFFGDGGAALGDVNGDHYDDVLVGATSYSGGAEDGRAYIFYGGHDMDNNADLILEGEPGEAGYFGVVIVTGDLNDDGYADAVVCANKYEDNRGRVYLYYGGNPMDAKCDLTLDGENTKDFFGRKACIGGDVNGDGYPDLILGARRYPRDKQKGRAYLFYGGNSVDNICDKTFTGETDGDEFGEGVAIFNVDDDGYADVIIGARGWNNHKGRAYLYWGAQDMDVNADKTFTTEPGSAVWNLGQFIWGGHVNADAYGDILIGACSYSSNKRGRAYLYYGDTQALMDKAADHTFIEESTGSCYGNRVTLGDLNNDSYDDVIISGYNYNDGEGRVWLYYGGPNKCSTDVTFNWDTTKASTGEHTLKAEIVSVTGEEDTADNTKTITVNVKLKVKEK